MLLKEFDQEKVAVINPDMIHQQVENFPETAVSIFSHELFHRLADFLGRKEIAHTKDIDGVWLASVRDRICRD